jgi:hypothetical protein
MRLVDHVTLHFNNNMPTAAVFLDIKKAFDAIWQSGLLYKWSKLQFSIGLIKLIGSFLSQRKFSVSVEDEMPTPRYMQAGVSQGSVLPLLYTICSLMIPPKPPVWTYMRQTARRATFWERSSVGSTLWRPGVNAGILKSMKTRLRWSTSLIEIDRLILFLSWMDGISHL